VHVYDSNPYPAPAPTPAPAPAIPDPATIAITSATLSAPSTATTFLVGGDNHDSVINNFLAVDVLNFEASLQDFEDLTVLPDAAGNALVTLGNNHITLAGVTPDDLTWKNFLINGQSNTNANL
jgi:hypothetical protein